MSLIPQKRDNSTFSIPGSTFQSVRVFFWFNVLPNYQFTSVYDKLFPLIVNCHYSSSVKYKTHVLCFWILKFSRDFFIEANVTNSEEVFFDLAFPLFCTWIKLLSRHKISIFLYFCYLYFKKMWKLLGGALSLSNKY